MLFAVSGFGTFLSGDVLTKETDGPRESGDGQQETVTANG
jgi:hypothetical protein